MRVALCVWLADSGAMVGGPLTSGSFRLLVLSSRTHPLVLNSTHRD